MERLRRFDIGMACDVRFADGVAGVMASARLANPSYSLHFHLLVPSNELEKFVLLKSFSQHLGCSCIIDPFDENRISGWPSRPGLPVAAYRRLFQPAILYSRCERYLYIDTDTLILGDLCSLFDSTPISIVAGVRDEGYQCVGDGLGYLGNSLANPTAPYINSGMMVVNPQLWTAHQITERCQRYISEHGSKVINGDQDAINATLAGRPLPLIPTEWNVQVGALDWKVRRSGCDQAEKRRFASLMRDAKVLHFVGPYKPWSDKWYLPGRTLWLRTLARTGYIGHLEAFKRGASSKMRGGYSGLRNRFRSS